MTDVSCMGCMFQDIQTESRGFLSVVFCLTNVKLLPPALWEYKCFCNDKFVDFEQVLAFRNKIVDFLQTMWTLYLNT